MPVPIAQALDDHDAAAATKARQARSGIARYMLASMLAGAYVGVAIVLLLMTSAPLIAAGSPFAKLVQGAVFGVALTLVVFAGAELFTGNNMVMLQGLFRRKVSLLDLALVWGASLVGNFLGSIAFAALVNASGIVTAGGTADQPTAFQQALTTIAHGKDALTGGQLFFRAVLCNFLVCLALWMAVRTANDAAKLVCLWWALFAFIAAGFEHSIANMTALGLAAFTGAGDWGMLLRNLTWTVPGNIVGGGVLVGLAYSWMGAPAASPVPAGSASLAAAPAPDPPPADGDGAQVPALA